MADGGRQLPASSKNVANCRIGSKKTIKSIATAASPPPSKKMRSNYVTVNCYYLEPARTAHSIELPDYMPSSILHK
jgi:hypothetical protein